MANLVSRRRYIVDAVREAVKLALDDTAAHILMLVRLYVPVSTGTLRDSYQVNEVQQLWLQIGTAILYAKFQELGFHHYRSGKFIQNPHLIPAVYQSEGFFATALERRLKEIQ